VHAGQTHSNRNSDYYYEDGARVSRRSRDKRSSRGSGPAVYDLENAFDSDIEDEYEDEEGLGGGEERTSTILTGHMHGGTYPQQSESSGDYNGMEMVPTILLNDHDHPTDGVKESEGI